MTSMLNQNNFDATFLGQSILRYQVPLDIYISINKIYESKYSNLRQANKQLVGKIEKEHSLFYNGDDGPKMTKHNHLTRNILNWFNEKFNHYLNWNKIKDYG